MLCAASYSCPNVTRIVEHLKARHKLLYSDYEENKRSGGSEASFVLRTLSNADREREKNRAARAAAVAKAHDEERNRQARATNTVDGMYDKLAVAPFMAIVSFAEWCITRSISFDALRDESLKSFGRYANIQMVRRHVDRQSFDACC